MAESLILKFDVKDDGSIKLKKITDSIDDLGESLSKTEKQSHGNISSLKNMAVAVGGLAAAYGALSIVKTAIADGFEYNRMMENNITALKRLIVATSGDVDSKGVALDITRKYTLATRDATEAMKGLEEINALTPHTLGQTTQLFNAQFAAMKKTGASTEEMIELTKRLSIATSNIPFQAVLAGVDALGSGTVLANSDFGRFLNSLGLTNEELRKTDDVAGLVNDRLKEMVIPAKSMDEATSNLTNSWQQLTGEMMKNVFADTKELAVGLAGELDNITNKIKHLRDLDKKREEFRLIDEITKASALASELNAKMAISAKGGFGAGNLEVIAAKADEAQANVKKLSDEYIKLFGVVAEVDKTELISSLTPTADTTLNKEALDAIEKYNNEQLKQKLNAEETLVNLRLQNDMVQNNVGGIEYLNALRKMGVGLETETGRQLVEQMALRDQLREEGADPEETIEKIDAIKEAYNNLRHSMFNEEALLAQFAGEVAIVEDAFNQKMVTEVERKALLEELELQHQANLGNIEAQGILKRRKFDEMTAKQKTKAVLSEMSSLTAGVANGNKAMFEINKAAALANAAIATPEAVMNSYAFGTKIGGPVLGAIMGGIALTAQMSQMQNILGASFGGGGGTTSAPTAGGGSTTTPGIAPSDIAGPVTAETRDRTFTFTGFPEGGAFMSEDNMRGFIEEFVKTSEDMNVNVRFAS